MADKTLFFVKYQADKKLLGIHCKLGTETFGQFTVGLWKFAA